MGLLDSIEKALHLHSQEPAAQPAAPAEAAPTTQSLKSRLIGASEPVAPHPKTIEVMSSAFHDGKTMRKAYTADGYSLLAPIEWKNVPVLAKSLVLVVEDRDSKTPEPFVHGIFYNLDRHMIKLPDQAVHRHRLTHEYTDMGVRVGLNSENKDEYFAPSPPPGDGWHHYHFQLIALDTVLTFSEPPTIQDLKKAIKDHVLAWGETFGMYKREAETQH